MTTRIKLRRDTAANWALANPVLALGEAGYDTTNNQIRVGDGIKTWILLHPIGGGAAEEFAALTLTGGIPYANGDILGEPVSFTRPNNSESTVDAIDTGLSLKRKNNGGALYNSANDAETQWNQNQSPLGTEWNADGWGDLTDVQTRLYTTFYNACDGQVGENVVHKEFVMHDIINDKYYKIDFNWWQPNNGGGANQALNNKSGFSYTRTPIDTTKLTYYVRAATDDSTVDAIDTGLTIKRDSIGGIYNIDLDVEWDPDVSPSGTLWNDDGWDDFTDITTRTWKPLYAAVHGQLGNHLVGSELIMWDTINDKYYIVKFTEWGQNNGGSFTYYRREINPVATKIGITFADGTVQKTALALGDLRVNGNVVRNTKQPGYGVEFNSTVNNNYYWDTNWWTGDANWIITNGTEGYIQFDTSDPGDLDFYNFLDTLGRFDTKTVSINDGAPVILKGWGYDHIYIDTPPVTDPTLVTSVRFYTEFTSRLYFGGENTNGFFLDNDNESFEVTSQDVNLYAKDDVRIQARDLFELRNNGIGSSIRIVTDGNNTGKTWAFTQTGTLQVPDINVPDEDGSVSTHQALQIGSLGGIVAITDASYDVDTRGGSAIRIVGQKGYGTWSTAGKAGDGTGIQIFAGAGGESSEENQGGTGGSILIKSGIGQAGYNGGGLDIAAGDSKWNAVPGTANEVSGGDVTISAGSAQSANGIAADSGNGGDVTISAGYGNKTNGEIYLQTSSNGTSYGNRWEFKNDGSVIFPTLTVPINDNANPNGTGQTLKFSDPSQQAIIYGPPSTSGVVNAERIIIQGAPGYAGTAGEGGDVYLWAGPGGDTNGNGGDIKVRAGQGNGTGTGGYVNIQAGDSGTGSGGYINIESGETSTPGSGGDISIVARSGGQITLSTYGNIYNQWLLDPDGKTTLPGDVTIPGAVVKGTVSKTGAVLADIGKGAAATVTPSPSNNTNINVGTVNNVYFATGFTLNITVAPNGDISAVVVDSNPNLSVGDYGTLLGGGALGGTNGVDDVTFTIDTITNVIARTPIDLTKSINKLADGEYSLANGVEGQVMYLVPRTDATNGGINVTVANARILNSGGATTAAIYTDSAYAPFEPSSGSPISNIATLIFTDGAWQASSGSWN